MVGIADLPAEVRYRRAARPRCPRASYAQSALQHSRVQPRDLKLVSYHHLFFITIMSSTAVDSPSVSDFEGFPRLDLRYTPPRKPVVTPTATILEASSTPTDVWLGRIPVVLIPYPWMLPWMLDSFYLPHLQLMCSKVSLR